MAGRAAARTIVERAYDAVADRYAALEAAEHPWPRLRWLAKFLERVEPGAGVLDVGCGNGMPATRAIAERYRATGVDLSAAQIERARRNVPDAEFIHADFTEVTFGRRFAAITAFYVIEHVPRERHLKVFERLHELLEPGGYLLFTVEPDAADDVVGEWLGQPMFFSQYDASETLRLLRDAGFDVIESSTETQVEGKREVAYLWVLAQRH